MRFVMLKIFAKRNRWITSAITAESGAARKREVIFVAIRGRFGHVNGRDLVSGTTVEGVYSSALPAGYVNITGHICNCLNIIQNCKISLRDLLNSSLCHALTWMPTGRI